jgi:spore coat polysaccharide biosynthesis predicted glycosyltransferase SpsG
VRIAAIAPEFLDYDHRVTYATTTSESARELCPEGITKNALYNSQIQIHSRMDTRLPAPCYSCNAYSADKEYQQRINERVPLSVYTDNACHSICADVLVNGNLCSSELTYDFVGESTTQLLGPDFVPLRYEIRLLADQEPPRRDPPAALSLRWGK